MCLLILWMLSNGFLKRHKAHTGTHTHTHTPNHSDMYVSRSSLLLFCCAVCFILRLGGDYKNQWGSARSQEQASTPPSTISTSGTTRGRVGESRWPPARSSSSFLSCTPNVPEESDTTVGGETGNTQRCQPRAGGEVDMAQNNRGRQETHKTTGNTTRQPIRANTDDNCLKDNNRKSTIENESTRNQHWRQPHINIDNVNNLQQQLSTRNIHPRDHKQTSTSTSATYISNNFLVKKQVKKQVLAATHTPGNGCSGNDC